MNDAESIRQVACPSCGAPIAFPPGQMHMRCPYCHVGLERDLPPEANPFDVVEIPIIISAPDPAEVRKVAKAGCLAGGCSGLAWLVGIVGLIGGIILAFLFFVPDSPMAVQPRPMQIHTPAELIGNDGAPADLAAISYAYQAEDYALTRLSLSESRAVWRSPGRDGIGDFSHIIDNGGQVFAIEQENMLTAYQWSDGSQLWQNTLVDKIAYCDTCLAANADQVIALTRDYTLQAFDARTGERLWQRRLTEYIHEFTLLDTRLAVLDQVDGVTSLYVLNLADGSTHQVIDPVCAPPGRGGRENGIYISTPHYFEPDASGSRDNGAVYFVYGSPELCLDRWSLATGVLDWQTTDAEISTSYLDEDAVRLLPDGLYLPGDGALWRVDKTSGQISLLTTFEDYELTPLTERADLLLVSALRTRGSPRFFEIWALDRASGERAWLVDLGESVPLDEQVGLLTEGNSAWTWRLDPQGLILVRAEVNPHQLITEVVNLADGSLSARGTAPFTSWTDTSYSLKPIAWDGPHLWLSITTQVLVLDTQTGMIPYHYP